MYARDNIDRLAPYVPGEQPGADGSSVVKLNTNENPYPPCDAVLEAIRAVTAESLRVYPQPEAVKFRATAAEVHGVGADQIIATNGGDELLRLAVTCFCEPVDSGGGGIGMTTPSYSLYGVLAGIHGTSVTTIERTDDFGLPDDLADRWNEAGCRLGFIVNPHAPTGRLETVDALAGLAERFDGVLLVDEAYVDFAPRDAIDLVRDGGPDNVLLLRSLSKGYSLAGLRFGYGVGPSSLIATLDKARDSYNTDAVSQAAAVAALRRRDDAAVTWAAVRDERDRLTQTLRQRGWHVPDSHSNFVLATPPADSSGARSLYESLKARRILVRYFDAPRLNDKLRITVGTSNQNDALLDALDEHSS